MLFGWQSSWAAKGEVTKAIVFVTAAQMLCGVAKDLTKLGGKTVTKLVTPDEMQVRRVEWRVERGGLAGWPFAAASHTPPADSSTMPCRPLTPHPPP
jgi:hypothetical protein